jgi:hypothetical protein
MVSAAGLPGFGNQSAFLAPFVSPSGGYRSRSQLAQANPVLQVAGEASPQHLHLHLD